jgi:hypothetical protein
MTIVVTLEIFSGRQNPVWILSDDQAVELMRRVATVEERTLAKPSGVLGKIGYRGFTIRSVEESFQGGMHLYVHEGIIDTSQRELNRIAGSRDLEEWLLNTANESLDEVLKSFVRAELENPPLDVTEFFRMTEATCPDCMASDAPIYDPGKWNIPGIQPYNNCYNYANNQITNTFAQPGRAHGSQTSIMGCNTVNPAAQADSLTNAADFSTSLSSGQGWYVALVVWPGFDYHWYRQDNNGCWSHKPGQTPAKDLDDSGNRITDPKVADRGPYTDFCTYMITNGTVVIQ